MLPTRKTSLITKLLDLPFSFSPLFLLSFPSPSSLCSLLAPGHTTTTSGKGGAGALALVGGWQGAAEGWCWREDAGRGEVALGMGFGP